VHDAGSFSKAAKLLGVPRSTVSRAIVALEDEVGARLFHRTTRSVSVSTAGASLYARAAPALPLLEGTLSQVAKEQSQVTGTVSSPRRQTSVERSLPRRRPASRCVIRERASRST
jgi:DNA-binding transcriptional LysR family regulator